MQVSAKGICEILAHEGIVPMPYRDSVGVWTFGIGHTASAGSPDPSKMAKGVERPMAEVLKVFLADLREFEDRVNAAVKVPLKQHEFDALVSFDFNTGGIHRAQLTAALNKGDREGAARGFAGWLKPPEIASRRYAEQALFAKGTYTSGGYANVYPATASGNVLYAKGKRVYVGDVAASLREAGAATASGDNHVKGAAGGAALGGGTAAVTSVSDVGDWSWLAYAGAAVAVIVAGFLLWHALSRSAKAQHFVAKAVEQFNHMARTTRPPDNASE